jgi:hypothetical protein
MPPIPLPFALHLYLSTRPDLRDWLQQHLNHVTSVKRRFIQRDLLNKFPNETLMLPTDSYPVFWTWERTSDKREVLAEMFGHEPNRWSGTLNRRLQDVARAIAKWDEMDKPVNTHFSMQSQVIQELCKQQAEQKEENEQKESETKQHISEDDDTYDPIQVGKVVSADPDTVKPVRTRRKSRAQPKERELMDEKEQDSEPVIPKSEPVNALDTNRPKCKGHAKNGNPCRFRATLHSEYCLTHKDQDQTQVNSANVSTLASI